MCAWALFAFSFRRDRIHFRIYSVFAHTFLARHRYGVCFYFIESRHSADMQCSFVCVCVHMTQLFRMQVAASIFKNNNQRNHANYCCTYIHREVALTHSHIYIHSLLRSRKFTLNKRLQEFSKQKNWLSICRIRELYLD